MTDTLYQWHRHLLCNCLCMDIHTIYTLYKYLSRVDKIRVTKYHLDNVAFFILSRMSSLFGKAQKCGFTKMRHVHVFCTAFKSELFTKP